MMNESSSGVGADATDDAVPNGDDLAARLANVVFEWRPAFASGPAPNASSRWMSRSARSALDASCDTPR
jgi:hypothetical protein